MTIELHPNRLQLAKPSFAVRRVPIAEARSLETEVATLAAGDVVLARIEKLGQHDGIERPDGRRSTLFVGDEIVVACGARYAPDQYHAMSPRHLGAAHLVAAGGIAGVEVARHVAMKDPTHISILGRLADNDRRTMNLARYAVAADPGPNDIAAIVVAGTAMNAGKTTTAAALVRGLSAAGYKVAAIKATGTGAGKDLWLMLDAGAELALDFTDAGFGTTYLADVDHVADATVNLLAYGAAEGCHVAVIEIADGLHQRETAALLQSKRFRPFIAGTIFAAHDALGAEAGVAWLARTGLEVSALSGVLTKSPLAIAEAQTATGIQCYRPTELHLAAVARRLVEAMGIDEATKPKLAAAG